MQRAESIPEPVMWAQGVTHTGTLGIRKGGSRGTGTVVEVSTTIEPLGFDLRPLLWGWLRDARASSTKCFALADERESASGQVVIPT
jgi:hypothetical protein